MADTEEIEDETPKKKSKLPLIIGLVLALAGGGGGFFAVYSGLILGSDEAHADSGDTDHAEDGEDGGTMDMPDVAFVPLEPMLISLPSRNGPKHLRFTAQLEVPNGAEVEVQKLLPRVVDVFNSYLRAVEVADLEKPTALLKYRSHLLRRAQLVLGDERVNNLLVMEFVVN